MFILSHYYFMAVHGCTFSRKIFEQIRASLIISCFIAYSGIFRVKYTV